MPDIETRIRKWRATLLLALGGAAEIVDELEGHLRDDLEQRLQRGEAVEQAWQTAVRKLGAPHRLAAEYARLAAPAWWWPIPAVWTGTALILAYFAWLVCGRWLRVPGGETQPLLAVHVMTVVIGYLLAFAAGATGMFYVAWCALQPLRLGQRRLLVRVMSWTSYAIPLFIGLGILLGGIWARDRLGQFWSNDPREIATLLFLLWSVALALAWRLQPSWQHTWILLALAGNVLACACWFGANLIASSALHSYGATANSIVMMLLYVGVFHAAVISVGLLPIGWAQRVGTRSV